MSLLKNQSSKLDFVAKEIFFKHDARTSSLNDRRISENLFHLYDMMKYFPSITLLPKTDYGNCLMRKEVPMIWSRSTKALAIVFFVSGLYDTFGGFYYSFLVGMGKSISSPPTHQFYALFIASFLFCFAYLQFMSAFNIKRYLFNVGVVIIGRVFYAVLLFAYILLVDDFPKTFLPTAIVDSLWTILYIVLTLLSDEVRFKDLFFPKRGDIRLN
jgi:hypothetical protein